MRVLTGLLCTLVTSFAIAADPPKVLPPYTRPTLIAHRGASFDAPEHTLAAYELALKHGADFVEPDLQLTKDGVLVCLHDTTLERTTNVAAVYPERFTKVRDKKSWPVSEFTLAEIQTLDAGRWKDAKFAGAKVPTFQQMIDLVKGKAGIIPETKAPEVYGKLGMNMEKAVMEILRRNRLDQPGADPKTPVVIQSFSLTSLKKMRREWQCELPMLYLFSDKTKEQFTVEYCKQLKKDVDGIGPHKVLLEQQPGLVKAAHVAGLSVTIFTCRSRKTDPFADVRSEMKHYLGLGVDAIFTDNPDQFPR
jgi:glycerophosphoryl diester phosphodiesterase